jgi:hypothetical protein
MMTHETVRGPVREPSPGPLEQPTLPFEEAAPASGSNVPAGPEMRPSEVWEALPQAMRAEVRRGCLRTVREVVGDAPE